MGTSGVGSKVRVRTIGVLEVNAEVDSIRAQRGRARSALFSRVYIIYRTVPNCQASEVAPEPDEKCGAPDKTSGIEYETSVDTNAAGKMVSLVT